MAAALEQLAAEHLCSDSDISKTRNEICQKGRDGPTRGNAASGRKLDPSLHSLLREQGRDESPTKRKLLDQQLEVTWVSPHALLRAGLEDHRWARFPRI
ncbi:hypothetical protein GCM10022276_11450 [Sphingomonas limnosediminicola]|uniref:Uncharacterized protein n=1 Tax=Sphingomonas limnosediminicola TaxID=940133 RepID=A0ABP7L412_9SPHN